MSRFTELLTGRRDRFSFYPEVGLALTAEQIQQHEQEQQQQVIMQAQHQISEIRQPVDSDWMRSYFNVFDTSLGGPSIANEALSGRSIPKAVAVVEEPSRTMLQRVAVDVENLNLDDPRQKLATEAEALLGYTPLREELRTPGTLKRVLARLEIQILDMASVIAYKKQMAEHYKTAGKMVMPTWRLTKLKDCKAPVPEYVLQKAVEIKRELPEAMFYVEQLAVDPFLIVTLKPLEDFVSVLHTLNRDLDPEMSAYVEVWAEPKFEATM